MGNQEAVAERIRQDRVEREYTAGKKIVDCYRRGEFIVIYMKPKQLQRAQEQLLNLTYKCIHTPRSSNSI